MTDSQLQFGIMQNDERAWRYIYHNMRIGFTSILCKSFSNVNIANEDIEDIIAGYVPRGTLIGIREGLTSILAATLVGHYEGFLGVDQMICQADSPVFIPVSEINLRMTMGLIARNQYDHFYLPLAL